MISTAYAVQPTLSPLAPAANWLPNAVGPVSVAVAAKSAGARFVHVSSDALHTGRPDPIGDTEPPSPTSPYGAAKAAAELTISTILPSAAIARVSLINSDGSDGGELSNRERFMLDLASGRATGVLFTDDVRRPIAGVARPGIVRLDPAFAATLLNTRLRGVHELLGKIM